MNATAEYLLSQVQELTKERDELQDQITELTSEEHSIPELRNQLQEAYEEKRKCYFAVRQQALTIKNLVKECDEWKNTAIKRGSEYIKMLNERDALVGARYAYANEFRLDEQGQPDVGSIHQNIRALKAAAKLALYALVAESRTTESNVTLARILTAIEELKKAGVQ